MGRRVVYGFMDEAGFGSVEMIYESGTPRPPLFVLLNCSFNRNKGTKEAPLFTFTE